MSNFALVKNEYIMVEKSINSMIEVRFSEKD